MMWLLDVNLPVALKQTLKSLGIQCETTEAMGWRQLTNGHLARTAIQNGFTAILTRDIEFATSAKKWSGPALALDKNYCLLNFCREKNSDPEYAHLLAEASHSGVVVTPLEVEVGDKQVQFTKRVLFWGRG